MPNAHLFATKLDFRKSGPVALCGEKQPPVMVYDTKTLLPNDVLCEKCEKRRALRDLADAEL